MPRCWNWQTGTLQERVLERVWEFKSLPRHNIKIVLVYALNRFLLEIGLFPNKSKTIEYVHVPDKYFIDFLRGLFDSDGYTYSYWDKRWKSSYMLYVGFVSASLRFLKWLRNKIKTLYMEYGKIKVGGKTAFILYFPKYSSVRLLEKIYYNEDLTCLRRKRFKIEQSLGIIHEQARVSKLVDELSWGGSAERLAGSSPVPRTEKDFELLGVSVRIFGCAENTVS